MHKATQAYFQTKANTTSQGEVVVLLYTGAISFLTRAIEQIKVKNYAEKGILISKALDVINELDSTLNHDKGGELAKNLHSLYFFCSTKLLQANLKMDIPLIEQIIGILSNLKSAFEEILNNPEAIMAAQETAMGQRVQPMHSRPVNTLAQQDTQATVGTARASSLYAKKTAEFSQAEAAPQEDASQPTATLAPTPTEAEKTHGETVETPLSLDPQAALEDPIAETVAEDARPIPQMRLQQRNMYSKFAQ